MSSNLDVFSRQRQTDGRNEMLRTLGHPEIGKLGPVGVFSGSNVIASSVHFCSGGDVSAHILHSCPTFLLINLCCNQNDDGHLQCTSLCMKPRLQKFFKNLVRFLYTNEVLVYLEG